MQGGQRVGIYTLTHGTSAAARGGGSNGCSGGGDGSELASAAPTSSNGMKNEAHNGQLVQAQKRSRSRTSVSELSRAVWALAPSLRAGSALRRSSGAMTTSSMSNRSRPGLLSSNSDGGDTNQSDGGRSLQECDALRCADDAPSAAATGSTALAAAKQQEANVDASVHRPADGQPQQRPDAATWVMCDHCSKWRLLPPGQEVGVFACLLVCLLAYLLACWFACLLVCFSVCLFLCLHAVSLTPSYTLLVPCVPSAPPLPATPLSTRRCGLCAG
jgi:hypothetical protein